MADLITRPDSRPASEPVSLADRLLDTQSPQRPQSSPRIRIEVDGRVIEGFEGQTILEVCRDNGIEIPTLCYEPKLPGFGACRMCVVEVEQLVEVGAIDPDQVHLPGIYVDRIVVNATPEKRIEQRTVSK